MPDRAWIGERHESPESAIYVGLACSKALEMAAANGVKVVRVVAGVIPEATVRAAESSGLKVLQPTPAAATNIMTMEYQLGNARLNLVLADDVVTKASFF